MKTVEDTLSKNIKTKPVNIEDSIG